jgi:hypothetical protein
MRSDRPAEVYKKKPKKPPSPHKGEYFDGYSWKPIEPRGPGIAAMAAAAAATAIANGVLGL